MPLQDAALETAAALVDGAVKPLKEVADKTLTTIVEIETQLKTFAATAVTKDEFSKAISAVQESMEKLRVVVETTLVGDPPSMPAESTPPSAEENGT